VWVARSIPSVFAQKLEIVRIVDDALLHLARPPVERDMAFYAPHLVTSLRLVDRRHAIRAVLARLSHLLDRRNCVGIALVLILVAFFDLVAFVAHLHVAHTALVVRRNESSAIGYRARANDSCGVLDGDRPVFEIVAMKTKRLVRRLHFFNLPANLIHFFVGFFELFQTIDVRLSLREKRHLLARHRILDMIPVKAIHPRRREIIVNEIVRELLLALRLHARGRVDRSQ